MNKPFCKHILFTTLLSLSLVTLIEFLLEKEQNSQIQYSENQIRLRAYKPNQSLKISPHKYYYEFVDNLPKKEFLFNTDQYGFISSSSSKTTKAPNYFFLGGSTTECLYVDESKRFPLVVQEKLNNQGYKINAFNGGVSGNHLLHSYNRILNQIIGLVPHTIFIKHNINDLVTFLLASGYWGKSKYRELIFTPPKKEYSHFIFPNIKKYIYKKLYWDRLSFDEFMKQNDEWYGKQVRKKINYTKILNEYSKALQLIIDLSKVYQFKIVLLTQPSRLSEKNAKFTKAYQSYYERGIELDELNKIHQSINNQLRKISKIQNIPLIDLDSLVPKNKEHIYDMVHFNNKGSLLVGEIISDWILKNDKGLK